MNKKKVLIDIDFVLRDWINALENTYILRIGDWDGTIEDLDKIWEYFPFPNYIEMEKVVEDDPEVTEKVMAVDKKSPWKPNRDIFNTFVHDNVLEIFGYAKESVPNAVSHLNKLQQENPDFEIILFSKVKGKAIAATLFFLSKTGCEIKKIKFIADEVNLGDCDIIITSNTNLSSISSHRRFILYTTQFNIKYNNYNRINSIKEILSFT